MRDDFSCKELGQALRVVDTRATQAWQPCLRKVARVWRLDPDRTLRAILSEVDALNALEPMGEAELELRERMGRGRADRSEVWPKR